MQQRSNATTGQAGIPVAHAHRAAIRLRALHRHGAVLAEHDVAGPVDTRVLLDDPGWAEGLGDLALDVGLAPTRWTVCMPGDTNESVCSLGLSNATEEQ